MNPVAGTWQESGQRGATELAAMERAIGLATRGGTHPNPCVGAVVLDAEGRVLAEGVTELWPGLHHGERVALEALAGRIPHTMVVTLEPCDHTGRTPPCTEAIIGAGMKRVVIGAIDPDSRTSGRGVERLRAAGVDVVVGCLGDEVEKADPAYFHHRRTGRARLVVKSAMTLDGQTAALDGSSQWITSEASRRDSHLLRAASDAVLVGAGTVRADDPLLTVRLDEEPDRQPQAVVVAGRADLPEDARLWQREGTIVIGPRALDLPVEFVQVAADGSGRVDPQALTLALGDRGLLAVLVEGGARLIGSLWEDDMIEGGVFYQAAKVAGGMGRGFADTPWKTLGDARQVHIDAVRRVGPDLRIDWSRVQPPGSDH